MQPLLASGDLLHDGMERLNGGVVSRKQVLGDNILTINAVVIVSGCCLTMVATEKIQRAVKKGGRLT